MSKLLDLAKQVIKASNCKPVKIGEFLSWNYEQVKEAIEINQYPEDRKLRFAFEYGMVYRMALDAIHTIYPGMGGHERNCDVYPIDIESENVSEELAREFTERADFEACETIFDYMSDVKNQPYGDPIQMYDVMVSNEIIRVEYSDTGSHLTEGSTYYLIPKDFIEG